MYYRGSETNGTAISYGGDAIQPGECFVYKVRPSGVRFHLTGRSH